MNAIYQLESQKINLANVASVAYPKIVNAGGSPTVVFRILFVRGSGLVDFDATTIKDDDEVEPVRNKNNKWNDGYNIKMMEGGSAYLTGCDTEMEIEGTVAEKRILGLYENLLSAINEFNKK